MPVLYRRTRGSFAVDLLWEPRDVWVGCYWVNRTQWGPDSATSMGRPYVYVYLCLVPLLPLRLRIPL